MWRLGATGATGATGVPDATPGGVGDAGWAEAGAIATARAATTPPIRSFVIECLLLKLRKS
jgi:hypothetical protein